MTLGPASRRNSLIELVTCAQQHVHDVCTSTSIMACIYEAARSRVLFAVKLQVAAASRVADIPDGKMEWTFSTAGACMGHE